MYSKYNLEISNSFYNKEINRHLETGNKMYGEDEEKARKRLREFIYENGHIDGTSMKKDWFQMEKVDIFISHSHGDLTKVKAFAGWLYEEFNLKVFIDSCVWGYGDNLLREIDEVYCKKKGEDTYDYKLRNYTTSHVHMMLSTALTEMIDRTECIMFYNTPNSVILSEDVETIKKSKHRVTLSPWIYHELAMTSLVGRKVPKRSINLDEIYLEHGIFAKENIRIEHNIDEYLSKMITLEEKDFELWKKEYTRLNSNIGSNEHPLDVLYSLPVIKTSR